MVSVDALVVADRAGAWAALGFSVEGEECALGEVRLRLTGPEATVAWLGDRVGEIRDAVQPGRRIATLRRSAGLGMPVAVITPPHNARRVMDS